MCKPKNIRYLLPKNQSSPLCFKHIFIHQFETLLLGFRFKSRNQQPPPTTNIFHCSPLVSSAAHHYLLSKIIRSKSHPDLEKNLEKKICEEQSTRGDFHGRELSPHVRDENEWEASQVTQIFDFYRFHSWICFLSSKNSHQWEKLRRSDFVPIYHSSCSWQIDLETISLHHRDPRTLITVGGHDIVVPGMLHSRHIVVHVLDGILEFISHMINSLSSGWSMFLMSQRCAYLSEPPIGKNWWFLGSIILEFIFSC